MQKVTKLECLNKDLMERLKKHFSKDFTLGECSIISKTDRKVADVQSLAREFSHMNIAVGDCANQQKQQPFVRDIMLEYNLLVQKVG